MIMIENPLDIITANLPIIIRSGYKINLFSGPVCAPN